MIASTDVASVVRANVLIDTNYLSRSMNNVDLKAEFAHCSKNNALFTPFHATVSSMSSARSMSSATSAKKRRRVCEPYRPHTSHSRLPWQPTHRSPHSSSSSSRAMADVVFSRPFVHSSSSDRKSKKSANNQQRPTATTATAAAVHASRRELAARETARPTFPTHRRATVWMPANRRKANETGKVENWLRASRCSAKRRSVARPTALHAGRPVGHHRSVCGRQD